MTESASASPAPRLEAAFTRIWKTRMQGLGFLNAALRVDAVGFREWEGEWLGVLVTPWSMNLVLMPAGSGGSMAAAGSERFVRFPAGRFLFISARDAELGEYHACSLLSPVGQFADHETARATAEAALVALFDPANVPGEEALAPRGPARPAGATRRDFLRGRASGDRRGDRG